MVVAHYTRSMATPRLRRGSRRVSVSPPLSTLPTRSRRATKAHTRKARADLEISVALSRHSDDECVSDPPSPVARCPYRHCRWDLSNMDG